MSKVYKCIKNFNVPYFDDDALPTNKEMKIKEKDLFEETEENFIDSEVTLINYTTGEWLGISKERLKENFVEEGEEDE